MQEPYQCQFCTRILDNDGYFCSAKCEHDFQDEQEDIRLEMEHERMAELEDPNAGCWSYLW